MGGSDESARRSAVAELCDDHVGINCVLRVRNARRRFGRRRTLEAIVSRTPEKRYDRG
jgi:hypothetical protein